MRNVLAAAFLAAIVLAPATLAGTVPPPICTPIVPAPPVPMPLAIPAPYPTKVVGPCGPASDLVVSTAAPCPPPPFISSIQPGEYCGKLYTPGQVVLVSATAAFPGVAVKDFRVVMGFDEFPYDGNLNPGETICISPRTPPSPAPVASTQCVVPGTNAVPLYRLIAWVVCPEGVQPPPVVNLGYAPPGIGIGP